MAVKPKEQATSSKPNSNRAPSTPPEANPSLNTAKKRQTTEVKVKFNVGFSNNLYIRGDGAGLSWERGLLMKNLKEDEWVWTTNDPFTKCEFKVLINDTRYEDGENHLITCGNSLQYSPHFP